MSKKIFEGVQRRPIPYYSHPLRVGRVEYRDLPKPFLDKVKELDPFIRFEFWNTGILETERGENAGWRCFRYIGPQCYEHVRWFKPWQVPSQSAIDWLNEADLFRHGPDTIEEFKAKKIAQRKAERAEKNKKIQDRYDRLVLGEKFDEAMRDLTKNRFNTKKLYSWQ